MLFTSETKVISVLIFDLNESGDLAAISVLGLIMLVVTSAIVALANRLRLGGRQRAAAGQLMQENDVSQLPSFNGRRDKEFHGRKTS